MRRSSVHLLCVSQRHSGWNQKSQICTHQTKGQISPGLMSIACVSWPKQVSSLLLVSFSSVFFAENYHKGLIHAVSSQQLMVRCVCYLNSVKHLFEQQFLRMVTRMNLSSAAEVTLGLPFLWSPHESQFHQSTLMFFSTALEETFKVHEMFHID